LYKAIQEQACFDPHMIDISIEHLITRPGVVVDVGANIGAYCLEIAVRFPECKIYAFDPVVPTSKELEGNIALNGFTNIESYRIGLGNKECEIEAEDPDVTGSYGCVTLTNKVQHILCQKTAIYKIRTLDSFNLSDVSLIKIDVEGMELEVIEGAVDTINRCSPMLIFEAWGTDWFAEHRTKVMQFVESLGYSLTVMNDDIIAVKQ
jgi:FkbM family methyltransferase